MKEPIKKSSGKPVRKTIHSVMSVTAAILLIAAGYFAYNFYNLSADNIYAKHFHHYELEMMDDMKSVGSPVLRNYREKKYKEASDAPITRPSKIEILVKAMSFLELGNTEKAIAGYKILLSASPDSSKTELKAETEYYLALAYIRSGDYDLALSLLQGIHDNKEHKYHNEVSARFIRQVKMLKWR